jgi:uncharacterized repeat protein (TIGR03809 family)
MANGEAYRRFGETAQKWRDLAEKRRAYYAELYRSGRWRHYYSEIEFVLRMRDVVACAETWARIAPRPGDEAAALPQHSEPVVERQRTAA